MVDTKKMCFIILKVQTQDILKVKKSSNFYGKEKLLMFSSLLFLVSHMYTYDIKVTS